MRTTTCSKNYRKKKVVITFLYIVNRNVFRVVASNSIVKYVAGDEFPGDPLVGRCSGPVPLLAFDGIIIESDWIYRLNETMIVAVILVWLE